MRLTIPGLGMEFRSVARYLGFLLLGFGVFPLGCLVYAVAIGHPDSVRAFGFMLFCTWASGGILYGLSRISSRKEEPLRRREAMLTVSLTWLAISILGAIPYLATDVCGWLDAIFETVSGFTTTGSSILRDVESLPKPVMIWRMLTQWIGGIGIVVLFVAIFPELGVGAKHMFFAEASGPQDEVLSPRIRTTAVRLAVTYLVLTVIFTLALWTAGMSFYDAVCHMMASLSTGGYSNRNASIGGFSSPVITWLVIVMMTIGSSNLELMYRSYKERRPAHFRNREFIAFAAILVVSGFLLWLDNRIRGNPVALRDAYFSAATVGTTTGFATVDFGIWSSFCKWMLVMLLFVGGCAGSTAGGVKVVRIILLLKIALQEIMKSFQPRRVLSLRIGSHPVDASVRDGLFGFLILYLSAAAFSVLVAAACGLDFEAAAGGTLATLGSVGPGLSSVGPAANFADVAAPAKIVFVVNMLLGRLEFYPLLVLFHPGFWR